ncbi:MAG: response regulator [Aquabacterium sp.]
MHILLLEDDLDLGQAILLALRAEGMTVLWVRTATEVSLRTLQPTPDAVLLDLGLPDADGLDMLRLWRRSGVQVPVIVISARVALSDRLVGLDEGADDYLPKPFAMAELISRLRAVHRRHAQQASDHWQCGALALSWKSRRVWLDGQALDLSPREFNILQVLARDPHSVVSKRELCRRLQPLGDPLEESTVEVHMSNLRKKIGGDRIKTHRGIGYQLIARP